MPYRVTGSVVDARSGEALAGLVVRAYDKDLLADDLLGATRTDAAGERLLYSTDRAPRSNTLLDEHFEIRIAPGVRAGESAR